MGAVAQRRARRVDLQGHFKPDRNGQSRQCVDRDCRVQASFEARYLSLRQTCRRRDRRLAQSTRNSRIVELSPDVQEPATRPLSSLAYGTLDRWHAHILRSPAYWSTTPRLLSDISGSATSQSGSVVCITDIDMVAICAKDMSSPGLQLSDLSSYR